jgi:hypothetical protein
MPLPRRIHGGGSLRACTQPAIDRLPGLVLVLLMARAGELNQLRASAAKLGAAPLN